VRLPLLLLPLLLRLRLLLLLLPRERASLTQPQLLIQQSQTGLD